VNIEPRRVSWPTPKTPTASSSRRTGRNRRRSAARPRRSPGRRPGEARGLLPRLPRRPHPPLDPAAARRTRPLPRVRPHRPPRRLPEPVHHHEAARLTHRRVEGVTLSGRSGDEVLLAAFTRLNLPHPFMTIAPQWDFLNLLAQAGADEPNFDLRMGIEATSL